jgi:DNA modification methylase
MIINIDEIAYDEKTASEIAAEKIEQIAASIREQGLLHPVTVQKMNASEGKPYLLITGLIRLLGVKTFSNEISVEVKENLDEYQREEIHLHENLRRGHLAWYDEVELVQRLHELRQRQHGASVPNRPTEGKRVGWSIRDTAAELDKALGGVAQDLQLARMVRTNPSLKNIKDKATATKVIRNTVKRIFAEEEATVSGDVPFANEIYLGESTTILNQIPDCVFDFCITDPPWIEYRDEELTRDDFTLPVFKILFKKMKVDSFMYMFVSADDFEFYKKELPKQGWKVQGHPCAWHKLNHLSRTGMRSWEHGRDLELILLAVRGSPVIVSNSQVSSIFTHAVVPSRHLIHPNEKPIGLIELILGLCSYEGSLGVDPFAGSGSHLEAMRNLKRSYVGIERDPHRFKLMQARLLKKYRTG